MDYAREQEIKTVTAEMARQRWWIFTMVSFFGALASVSLAGINMPDELRSLRPILPLAAFFGALSFLLGCWMEMGENITVQKLRSHDSVRMHLALCVLWYALCTYLETPSNSEFLRHSKIYGLPVSFAWRCMDGGQNVPLAGGALLLHACASALLTLGDPARCIQTCMNCCMCNFFLFQLVQGRADEGSDKAQLASMCHIMQRALSFMCDGYCVLSTDGRIIGADRKLESLLCQGTGPESLAGRSLGEFLSEGPKVSLNEGLLPTHLRCGDSTTVPAETYTVAGDFTGGSLRGLLGFWCNVKATDVIGGYLCVVRQVGESTLCASVASAHASVEGDDGDEALEEPALGAEAEDPPGPAPASLDEAFELESCEALSQAGSAFPSAGNPGNFFPSMKILGIAMGEYTRLELVYRSAQSAVWKAQNPSGALVAMKEVPLPGVLWRRDFPGNLRRADREVRCLKRLQWASAVVVQIRESWLREDMTLCIVLDWCPLSLKKPLEERRDQGRGPPDFDDSMRWTAHVAAGMAVIHSEGILHRDLKPSNILLDADMRRCKIADFGLSREVKPDLQSASDCGSVRSGYTVGLGTKGFRSPEILTNARYDASTDIFSLGCVLLELLCLVKPMAGLNSFQAQDLLQEAPGPARALCVSLLESDPRRRPRALELSRHELLRPHTAQLLQEHPELGRVLHDHHAES